MSALPAIEAAMRRGVCPALSAPMQTGDGLLVRLALAEGGLAPATLAALCEAAVRHGNGLVEITARGSFQIRGLTQASAPLLAAGVNGLDIPVRDGVPVETSPLAGLDPAETADPLPLVRAMRAGVAEAGLSARLGPKVSVVVDGGGAIALGSVSADVRLEAVSDQEWRVSAGGVPLGKAGSEDQAAAAALLLLAEIAVSGRAARGRDFSAAALAGIAVRSGMRPLASRSVLPDISSLDGEMAGRTKGDAKGRPHPGILPLRKDLAALAVALPFGQCEAAAIAELALSTPGIADFRFAPGRGLLALGSRQACEALRDEAAALGFVTAPGDPRLRVAACPGAPACASGLIPAREIGAALAAMLPPGFAGTVHVSGCAKGCAHPAPAPFVLVGTQAGIALVRAGKASDTPAAVASDVRTALDLLRGGLIETAA